MHFHFKADFLYYENIQTETNCTLNFGLKSWKNFAYSVFLLSYQPQKKTVMNFPRENLSIDLLTFLQNDNWVFSLTSTFHSFIS